MIRVYEAAVAWVDKRLSKLFSQKVNTNRSFHFQKRSQLLIGTHDETLSVSVCVNDPD